MINPNPLDTPVSDSDAEMETSAPPAGGSLLVANHQEEFVREFVVVVPENPISSVPLSIPAPTENSYFVNIFEILEYVAYDFAAYPSGIFNDDDIYQSAEYHFGVRYAIDIDTFNQPWQRNFFLENYESKKEELRIRNEEIEQIFAAPPSINN